MSTHSLSGNQYNESLTRFPNGPGSEAYRFDAANPGPTFNPDGSITFTVWVPYTGDEVELYLERPYNLSDLRAEPTSEFSGARSREAIVDSRCFPMRRLRNDQGLPTQHCQITLTNVLPNSRYGFRINGADPIPDPYSREQASSFLPWVGKHRPGNVHGLSVLASPTLPAQPWQNKTNGMKNAAVYQAHVGTFGGTFEGLAARVDAIADMGFSHLLILPPYNAPGMQWGYSAANPFAFMTNYAESDNPVNSFRELVEVCHARNIQIIVDVVYNHPGPEGSYEQSFGSYFKSQSNAWGNITNFDASDVYGSRERFLKHVEWLFALGVDGLRIDAADHLEHGNGADTHIIKQITEIANTWSLQTGQTRQVVLEVDWARDHFTRILGANAIYDKGVENIGAQLFDGSMNQVDLQSQFFQNPEGFRQVIQKCNQWVDGIAPSERYVNRSNHDRAGNTATGSRTANNDPMARTAGDAVMFLLLPGPVNMFQQGNQPFPFFQLGDDAFVQNATREGRAREFGLDPDQITDPTAYETYLSARVEWSQSDIALHSTHLAQILRLRQALGNYELESVDWADAVGGTLVAKKGPVTIYVDFGQGSQRLLLKNQETILFSSNKTGDERKSVLQLEPFGVAVVQDMTIERTPLINKTPSLNWEIGPAVTSRPVVSYASWEQLLDITINRAKAELVSHKRRAKLDFNYDNMPAEELGIAERYLRDIQTLTRDSKFRKEFGAIKIPRELIDRSQVTCACTTRREVARLKQSFNSISDIAQSNNRTAKLIIQKLNELSRHLEITSSTQVNAAREGSATTVAAQPVALEMVPVTFTSRK